MKNKLIWYANRLQSMSNREVLYRIKKHIQGRVEKLATKKNKFPFLEDYEKVFTAATELPYNTLPQELIEEFRMYNQFHFFSYTIDITQPIHWHKDISTNKKFPLKFSKNINIRSDEYGNAKIVWEINRLQFLLPLAIKCRLTKNEDDLNLWMDIMKSWVTANPYLKGVNWYSNIEVNIRLIIWHYCWQILYGDEKIRKNKKFIEFTKTIWLPSIYEHCRYSYKNPSKYSSANNHAIAEYAGLFVASCCWHFTQSATWKAYAQKGLEKQIIKQHSENGINKEEAAEYIQFITDFLLIALAVGQQYKIEFSTQYKKYLQSIFNYILNLLDIKGNYPKYGDEDDGKVLLTSTDTTFNNFLSILTSAAIISNNGAFKWRAPIFDIKNWLLWG
ncbi:MAG TPA: heparinase II/III family protein, partial [Chitinophagaceae bacterium]|nr:heparinase II/III family protein [Chitinophagaceae bacterium]